jgi:dihydropteroate synthase
MSLMQFRNQLLDFSKKNIYIMGILNVTPDSFSDAGKYNSLDKALIHAEEMINHGASIIDIGGESTRPFSQPVGIDEELDRVIPVIEKISSNFKTVISVDTYKSQVADQALKSGAEIINDISGFTYDQGMISTAKKHNSACIVMHIKGTPKDMQIDPRYNDVIGEIYNFLEGQINLLRSNGLNNIIIDPGFGFGKTLDDNYRILNDLDRFSLLGIPVMAGISRKSMIGKVIGTEPDDRLSGTIALNTIAALKGAKIIRVHDVKENFQAVKVIEKYFEFLNN